MIQNQSSQMISEMKEFGSFTGADQRSIRRALDVGLDRADAVDRWARNAAEAASITNQARIYRTLLQVIRASIPDDTALDLVGDSWVP